MDATPPESTFETGSAENGRHMAAEVGYLVTALTATRVSGVMTAAELDEQEPQALGARCCGYEALEDDDWPPAAARPSCPVDHGCAHGLDIPDIQIECRYRRMNVP